MLAAVSNLDTALEFFSVCVLVIAATKLWDKLRGRGW